MTANSWIWLSPSGGSFSSAANWGTVVEDGIVNGVPGPGDVGDNVQGAITGSGTIGLLSVIGNSSFTGVITADEIALQGDVTNQGTLTATDEFLIGPDNSLGESGSGVLNGPTVEAPSGPFGNAGFENYGTVTMSGFTELNAYAVDDFDVLQVSGGIVSATKLTVGSATAEASMTLGAAAVATDTLGQVTGLGSSGGSGSVSVNGGTWENQELIVGAAGPGSLVMNSGATVTATGPFAEFPGAPALGVGFGSAAGAISIGSGSLLEVTGVADIAAHGSVSLSGGTLSASGSVSIAGSLSGQGSIEAPVSVAGSITASGGTLVVQGLVSGTGVLTIAAATLDLQAGIDAGSTVDFAGGLLLLESPTATGATIADFGTGDTIVVQGVVANSGTFASGVLTLGTGQAALPFAGTYHTDNFQVVGSAGETTVTYVVACFAEGTRLLTAAGQMAVEALAPGDLVATRSGRLRRVRWIGHRRIEPARHPRPRDLWPVRVEPHAFGPGVPHRCLRLSPDHAVYREGSLIPVRYLCNGTTIRQEPVAKICYYHVELDVHDIVLAEGLPAESFLDTGNRSAFANGGGIVMSDPEFALRIWREKACAPLVVEGPVLAAARRKLLDRAAALGHAMTDDPGLQVLVDEVPVPAIRDGARWRVELPAGVRSVRLRSRSFVPGQIRVDDPDHRRLGVAIVRLTLDGRVLALDNARLCGGWHGCEPALRWTDGDAVLLVQDARELEFELALLGQYWLETRADKGLSDQP